MTASGVAAGEELEGYAALLEQLKAEVRSARTRAVQAVNNELLSLYWRMGRLIVTRRQAEGWGSRVIARLSADLHAEFPQARGFSAGNLDYMRRMATAWPDEVSLRLVGRLGWGHVQTLLDKLDTAAARDWYAAAAVEYGWTRNVLVHQIATGLRDRVGAAPSNFADQLPAPDSELAQQMTRDPLLFRFLDLGGRVTERQVEQALVDTLTETLLALGSGFAFVGRQVHLNVDGEDFYLDLLFFHVEQLRYVVVELKVGRFAPADVGQLAFYVEVVDAQRRRPEHRPTVGLLLCTSRNEQTVRYALRGTSSSVAVVEYAGLPANEQAALPADAALVRALEAPVTIGGQSRPLAEHLQQLETHADDNPE